ncbi:hypothetical protein Ahy_Scaffold6g107850 isoform E [Arachis hypogaea]|uniref:Protein kinase domain-containing protein n=1 Tax=Arachis hypogaea TaxID=3818 RepID=A0A444WPM0_ARAHY|nr:hypothetical protein Ahy_Scaffold6g107850 isoform E [Arachis hypogaea]
MWRVLGVGHSYLLILMMLVSVRLSIVEAQKKSFLINCGSNSSVNVDGRRWVGDMNPNNNVTLSSPGVAVSTSPLSGISIYDSLYKTARIFTGSLNYTIKDLQGNYVLRFHFSPFVDVEDYNVNKSSFSVVANSLKLLSEFNVPEKISQLQNSGKNSSSFSLIKEYLFDISAELVIEFVSTGNSFGFVNAIEVVPVVDELFASSVRKVGGGNLNVTGRGMETMYRLNVGGPEIQPDQDPDLWRTWEMDSGYMITQNAGIGINNSSNITYASANDTSVAPLLVYETARAMSNTEVLDKRFNMSWKFEVDPDFDYLVRLHFCELVYDKANERIFKIYINNRTAADNVDVYVQAGGKNKAYHLDYFDAMSLSINTLWVQLGPDAGAGAAGTDALLNGLEIFKLSRNGNLAYVDKHDSAGNAASKSKVLWVGIGAGLASIAVIAVIVILVFCFCRSQKNKSSDTKNNSPGWRPLFLVGAAVNSTMAAKGSSGSQKAYGSVVSTRAGKHFTLAEIIAATKNFDESLVIGVGGFGKGSFGYLDPEYFRRQQLTEKSDVYSFGVVLFEVVCARAVINPTLPKDQINLAEWAMRWQRQRSIETIIDPHLRGNYCPESLAKFGEIAEKCLADDGKSRPTMGEVLWHLEYVLQLHEAWLNRDSIVTSFSSSQDLRGAKDGGQELVHESSSQDEENE